MKYKEIIKQKDIEINNINKEYINSKQNLEKILELQRKISELKTENNQLILKIQEIEKSRIIKDLKNENQKNININCKESSIKIKSAYQALIEENEQLKENILNLRQYHN